MARYELFSTTLICEVKKHEVIYNIAHPDRVDLSKRHKAWAEISKSLDENVLQCKARWAGLRVRYKLELSKMTDPNYTSQWKYIDQMDFLKEFIDINSNKNFLQKLAFMSKRDLFCRACLCPIDKNSEQSSRSYNIFDNENIVERLIECTNLKIEPSDKYPHSLCDLCYKKLLDFHKFQCMCRDSLEKFNTMLKNDLGTNMNNDEDEIPQNLGHNLSEYDDTFELKTVQTDTNIGYFNKISAGISKNYDKNCDDHISEIDPLTENEDLQHIINNYLMAEHDYSVQSRDNTLKTEKGKDTCKENEETVIALNKFDETSNDETANTDTSELIELIYEEERSSQDEEDFEGGEDEDVDELEVEDVEKDLRQALNAKKAEKAKAVEHEDDNDEEDDTDDEQSEEILDDQNSLLDDLKTTKSHGRYPLKCDICPQSFRYQHRLEAHQRQHQGLAGYHCTYDNCERAFNRLTDLRKHINEHNGISNEFKCDVDNCSKVYGSRNAVYNHMRLCHNIGKPVNKKYECEICNAVLTSMSALKGHRYTHMDKSQWPLACNVDGCKIRFRMRRHMIRHLKRHAGIKNYVCPHCGARKTTSTELSIHINFHTFEKKYPCSLCPKVLKSSGMRSTHIHTVHEGMKLNTKKIDGVYQKKKFDCPCQFCGRQLANPQSLKIHELTHTGEKPYECKICGKRFTSPTGRHIHMRVHSDEKLYKCDECQKAFKKSGDLKIHKMLHVEGAVPYTCEQCGQGFRWPGSLYAHKKKHHNSQNEANVLEKVHQSES